MIVYLSTCPYIRTAKPEDLAIKGVSPTLGSRLENFILYVCFLYVWTWIYQMVITCINTTTFQHCNGVLLTLYPDFEFRHLCQSLLYNYNCTEKQLQTIYALQFVPIIAQARPTMHCILLVVSLGSLALLLGVVGVVATVGGWRSWCHRPNYLIDK